MPAARACLCAAVLTFVSALAAPAPAAGSAADREAARSLSGKAYELFETSQYLRAIELFRAADAHFHAPPHLLYVARAQVKLGLLVEARGTYERVLDEKLAADAPGPFKEAQVAARAELAEVDALMPSLVLTLPSSAPPGTRVRVDGVELDPAVLGRPLGQNPGPHTVTAAAPGTPPVERVVMLRAGGGEVPVTLVLEPPRSTSIVPAVIAAFGVGVAGVGVGTAAAVLLDRAGHAPTTGLRIAEIAGFAGGGVGIGAGILFVALRAGPRPAPVRSVLAPRLRVGVGLGSVSLSGAF